MNSMNLRVASKALAAICAFASIFVTIRAQAGTRDGTGGGNPQATYCESHGGHVIGVSTKGDENYEVCRLSDDSIIESGSMGGTNQASANFLKADWTTAASKYEGQVPEEKWAGQFCTDLKGKVVEAIPDLRPSDRIHLCHFDDGSEIEVWTLFSGPSTYPKLEKHLNNIKSKK